jgi:hypothetical protein
LPSSQSSAPAAIPLPQAVGVQLLSQPSPLTKLPSSQISAPVMVPSPQLPQTPFAQAPGVPPFMHAVPSISFGLEQVPVAGAQVPATWHWSSAVQVTGLAPVHAPAWHVSLVVHALLSLQAAPFALFGFEQVPFAGLHVPALWHWSSAMHVTGVPAEHAPAWHVSLVVHALPSLQAAPFALFGLEQVPFAGLQVPASWH